METIVQSYRIKATISTIWDALTNAETIRKWSGNTTKMDGKKGTAFSLWGGSIWGKNIEVVPQKKLVQEWFSDSDNKKWEEPSIVTFSLKQEEDSVKINLVHASVPEMDAKSIEAGWKEYYMGPLQEYVEKKEKNYGK